MNLQIIEVPSPLGLRPSGLEHAPDALRSAGLHERLGCPDVVRIEVPSYSGVRDPATEILNPRGIAAVALHTAGAVSAALEYVACGDLRGRPCPSYVRTRGDCRG